MDTIRKISIIGSGNVGSHLAHALESSGIEITHFKHRTDDLKSLPKDQLVLLCVPDDVISELVSKIDESCSIAYTSGSVELNSLPTRNLLGVFYPLQTFSKDRSVDLASVPFFIESSTEEFGEQLFALASTISKSVSFANSEERKKMHLAAVWINNFTNHIVHIAQSYCEQQNVDFNHLKPLLKETIEKLEDLSPLEAQTGPARRGDTSIIEQHLSQLKGTEKELYQLLSESITKTYSRDEKL
ncbi:MAG: DUF2520 domain-containing protein [Crocinitomicaceae bacterium]|nr:DUF2520 domain-containing protein [Crocinitomicaceae bacterium]